MGDLEKEKELIQLIRQRFPAEASRTDKWLTDRGSDKFELEEMTYAWIEAFADRTKEAVQEHSADKVSELTSFMAQQYRTEPDVLGNIIDVAYAENIMWGIDTKDRKWAWPHIANEIQKLYKEMWGVPRSKNV